MKKFKITMASIFILALFLTSCSQEEAEPAIDGSTNKATLSFGATLNDLLNNRSQTKNHFSDVPECSDAAPAYVMVVLSLDGEDMDAVRLEVLSDDLNNDGVMDYFTDYSADLELTPDQYVLEQFVVYDSEDNIIWIAPIDDDNSGEFNGYVINPLPMIIDLGPGVKKYVDVEVLCFDDREVNQYGYLFFDLVPRELKEFCLFANYCTPNGRHYTANYSLELWYIRDGEDDIQLYPRATPSVPFTGNNDSNDYYAEPLCVVIPMPQFGEEADDEYLYYRLTLLDWPGNYGNIEDGAYVEDGYLSWENIEDLLGTNDASIDYLHIFFNCDDTPGGGDCPAGPGDLDGDCVPDNDDVCPGYDDRIDSDDDGTPDGCDMCEGGDDDIDEDANGIPDGCDYAIPGDDCETAFMFGDNTFISLGLTNGRWGWAEEFDEVDGSYNFDLYAGAGRNITSNGYKAGVVTITVSGVDVEVDIDLEPGVTLSETHIYLNDVEPWTTAPGQYGNTDEEPGISGETYNLTYSGDGDFWIVVHAVTCQ
ncbi:hypothetical protein RM545_04530 [Zunongwangia sp. F260]|uniref:Uncharacterized protein n=1 Tax=Autumnicola lenta TaxID=3075593 RepID=A0ABU3CI39_9FLAO|nr:hypothetical protein [Zunongwangia sp. F260]MDT0645946.1 hypothetical protein [Zunongwangia sp. F260]